MKFFFITPGGPEYHEEKMLRWEVLGKSLGLSPEMIIPQDDAKSLHFVAKDKKKIVGCICFSRDELLTRGKISQMAISEEYQGQAFGRQLLSHLERSLADKGITDVYLYAEQEAREFYQRLGYSKEEEVLSQKGISHWLMRKNI